MDLEKIDLAVELGTKLRQAKGTLAAFDNATGDSYSWGPNALRLGAVYPFQTKQAVEAAIDAELRALTAEVVRIEALIKDL